MHGLIEKLHLAVVDLFVGRRILDETSNGNMVHICEVNLL